MQELLKYINKDLGVEIIYNKKNWILYKWLGKLQSLYKMEQYIVTKNTFC